MKAAIFGWLAAALLLPWFEINRRGHWHLHRVPRRDVPGYEHLYRWRPADRFDRFCDRGAGLGLDSKSKKSINDVQSRRIG